MIEFQYFDSCPNAEVTLSNLKELVEEGFLSQREIKITEVPDLDASQRLNFQGSPSILCNGWDIYTNKKAVSSYYTCRIY